MAGRSTWTGYVSTGISVLIAAVILAQFIVPDAEKSKIHKTKAEAVKPPEPVQKPDPIPTALVLPAPPKPAPPPPAPKVTEVQPAPPVPHKATPKPKPKPVRVKAPAKPRAPAPFVPAAADVIEGRTLLRTLEHGKGPLIEIAWPNDRSQHGRLFKHMTSCLGMRVAVMDGQSMLFVAEGQTGLPWDINLDRYSGFLRQPAGWLSPSERQAETAIRMHHNMKTNASGVRIFPRPVDAALLGG